MALEKLSGNDKLKMKLERGQILKTLAIFYPRATMLSELKLSLTARGIGTIANLDSHLQYLQDAELIKRDTGLDKVDESDDLIRLIKKGVNLIEGDYEDAGVML
ncbi:hypothetical protein [Vallitalea guaymasensis]|uniref:hypothetical protein n=1 Tax=Vallitalea guaymasensis TaxID=1185412 RepID=UPI000DE423AF|nr:hypothetical protein [Vallitalea guaymasensis]